MRQTAGEWKRGVCSSKRTPEEQREAGRDDAGSIGVSGGHERRGQRSGNDGTEDQGVREAREHRHSGVPQGRHRDSPDGRGTDENAPHHECAQVDGVPRHQSRSDECRTSATCRDDESVDSFSKGSPKGASKGTGNSKDSVVVCWYCEKKGHRAPECPKRQKGAGRENRQVRRKAMATVLEKARNGSKANFLGGEKSGHMSKDCRSKETSAFEADEDEPSSETGWFEHGEHQS